MPSKAKFPFRQVVFYLRVMRAFYHRVSWWCSIGVWLTSNHLKSPGLFLVSSLISILLKFGWSPLIFLFSSPPVPYQSSGDYLQASITIGITVPSMSRCSLARTVYLSLLSPSFSYIQWSSRAAKSTIRLLPHFFLSLNLFFWPSVYISKSQRRLWVSFSITDSGFCIYHLFVW